MALTTDNIREWWNRITPRERMLVMAAIGTVAFLICWWIGTTIVGGLDAIEKKNERSREALAALHEYRIRQAQGMLDEKPEVPLGDSPVELESFLNRVVKDLGIDVPGYQSRPEDEVGDYKQVSTRFDVRGMTILELKDLLQAIETRQQGRVVITDLRIKRQFREQEKLDVEITVATYYKPPEGEGDEKEEG